MANKTGRKTKLTPEFIEVASKLIAGGNPASTVAARMGIVESTWYDWISRGEREKSGLFSEFSKSIKKAQPVAKIAMLSIVTGAASEGNWQAAAWYLERTDPEHYGRRDRIRQELTGPDGSPLQQSTYVNVKVSGGIDLDKLSDNELVALNELLEKGGSA